MFHSSVGAGFVLCVGLPLGEATRVARLLRDSAVVLVTADLEGARTLLEPAEHGAGVNVLPMADHVASVAAAWPAAGLLDAGWGAPVRAFAPAVRDETGPPPDALAVGAVTIDAAAREVTVRGVPVHLSAREFDLLAVLASDIGRVWSFATLTQQLWGTDLLGDKDPLTSTVKRLRRRLGAAAGCQVASVHGIGYRLRVVTS
jgi:hypothetical protein